MNQEDAMEKALQAYELGIIEFDQVDAYAKHLVETHSNINKDVSRGIGVPTNSSTEEE